MVNIKASVMVVFAATSFVAAAPAEPRSAVPRSPLEARSDVDCRDDNWDRWTRGNTNEAVQCINQLAALGDQACEAAASAVQFCRYGNTVIMGMSRKPIASDIASSRCQDVARGAGLIMDACTRGDGTVMGQNPAWGNGNLLITIVGA
ncbi:hypothetical protein E4T49_05915 [Aureobasidium sp. EXF-10728]|nr:hypothetical protein E4T49_05915 [Aureobasidium sp. EXF-10728]